MLKNKNKYNKCNLYNEFFSFFLINQTILTTSYDISK